MSKLARARRSARAQVEGGYGPPADRSVAYAGSSTRTRDLVTWRPGLRSADAELLPERGNLVSRSRDLERNSGIAKGGIQTLIDNVVGTGLRLNPNPNYLALGKSKEWADDWSRQARALWWSWAETTACDAADTLIFDQMTAQVFRAQLSSGDAFGVGLWLPERGDGWATKIQTIDADRLSTPPGRSDSLNLRAGVQMDEYGAPLGYWIRRAHPGDCYAVQDASSGTWAFVPKRNAIGRRVGIHCFDKERSGQSRGKPIMSSVLSNFKGLDRYTSAEIQAAVINAMVALIIETPLDQSGIEALFRDNKDEYLKARQEHAVAIESGSTLALFPGDKANSFAPQRPNTAFGAFQENVGRIIALGFDMPYELLFKDFTKANYSSMRAAMLEAWRSFNRRRDDLGTQWADACYMLVIEEAINDGRLEGERFYEMPYAYCRCNWIGPGRGWVDPMKEAQASKIRRDARISTLRDECAEQGKDWVEVMDQLATEQAYAESLDLAPDPATVVPANAMAQNGEDEEDDQTEEVPQQGVPGAPPRKRASLAAQIAEGNRELVGAITAAVAARGDAPAPIISIAPPAITVNNPVEVTLPEMSMPQAPPPSSEDAGLSHVSSPSPRRVIMSSEVVERDEEGRTVRVRQTGRDAESGVYMWARDKVVTGRGADGRITGWEEVEVAE